MKTFTLKKFETFQITGRGTVFTVHRDENDVEGIARQDVVITPDKKRYVVTGIEMFRNTFGIGKNIGLLVREIKTIELKLGTSCGSCIHTNRPKKPREHAAHYEVAKTERWCFLHNCHVTRETTCDDHEGVNRAAKTAFTRTKNYNERLVLIKEVVELLGGEEIKINDYTFYVENNWLKYYWGIRMSHTTSYSVSGKQGDMVKFLEQIKEKLNNLK